MQNTATRYTAERATGVVSSTDDYSRSTCSYTGDSGFSDSQTYLKELPPKHAHSQREQDLDSSVCTAGYYKSLNQESRIPGRYFLIGVIYYLHDHEYLLSHYRGDL